jgi:hypothetical protein
MNADSTETEPVHPGPPPGLLRLVKVLGVIMLLLFLALIGGIIWKATRPAVAPVEQIVLQDLGFDPATVRHLALDGNTLALTTDDEVVVIDLRARKVTLRAYKPSN